ncbi:MAG: transporter substrate-binding domain-containing protein, partial [Desulfobacula sp.]|nr:transporter substrate-binding domain-containing protein [Desulfobacula sp.]
MLKINKEKFKICIIFFAILFMDFFFIGHGFAAKTELSLDELKLTREEMTWLKSKESIRIGGPRAFPPFHYFDDQGRLKGISADYIFAIMNKLGVKLEVQKDLPWTEVLNKAKSGKIDLIPCAAKTIDREVYLNFSTPYLSFPLVILTSKDAPYIGGIEDLHGKKLAVIKKNAVSSWLKKDKIKFEPYYVESPLKKLETISFGRVDAGIENLAAASYIIQKYGLANVKIAAPTPYGNYNLHMAVRKDLPELLGVINKVIDSITPEQHIQIRSKWLSVRYEHGINKVYILKWILAISIFSMTIIVIVLFWNRRLKKAESALKESERKLSTLMDNLPGIAYQCLNDVNWTMLYISNGCYELTGYEPFELVKNQTLSYGDLIVEDDRQYVEDEIQIAINGKRAFAIEYRIRDKNQNIKWLWEKGRGIFDKEKKLSSLEGFITDITERKQAEKKIKNHAANLKAIFDSTPNILVLVNDESRVEMINNRGAAFLGKKKEELYGLLGGEVFNCLNSFDGKGCGRNADCSLCPVRTQIMLTFQKGKPHTEEEGRMTFLLNEKEISMDLLISTALLNLDGANKVLLSLADITARKKAEAEKKKLESQLQQAQKMESIGTLAGGIAHDFNNILFPILGYAEMVLEDLPENSPFQDSLKGIFTSALRAKGLVKQILTFSRQDKNELKLMKMQPIIKEALKLIRSTIPTTIEIKQDINPDCGIIKADPTQIHQIVMNLATNAYHAMEDTGGELKVSLKQMEFKTLDLINSNMAPGVYACLTV